MRTKRRRGAAAVRTLFCAMLLLVAGAAVAAAQEFPAFLPMPGVNPEGVAVDKAGNVYVSVREGTHGAIWKFTPDGGQSRFADVGTGMIGGLAISANGTVYVAMAAGSDQGVYRLDRDGEAELLPGTGQIVFANALAFDSRGTLYVTESYSNRAPDYGPGGVWRIQPGEEAGLWIRHPLLTGIGAVLGYPVGANGIGFYHGDLFVVNTDKALVVRIQVRPDGSPGPPEVWTPVTEVPESPSAGGPFPLMADGLALDVHGNVYVTVISRNAVVRINAEDRSQDTIALLAPRPRPVPIVPFDTPASLAFGTGAGEQQHLFVRNLGWMTTLVPGPPWPGPGLVKVDPGVPGRPLR